MKKNLKPTLAAKVAMRPIREELDRTKAQLAEANLSLQAYAERSVGMRQALADSDTAYSALKEELADAGLANTKRVRELVQQNTVLHNRLIHTRRINDAMGQSLDEAAKKLVQGKSSFFTLGCAFAIAILYFTNHI